ncbi:NAD(P)H-dependent oxidoreductase [Vibrio sonorensis]|uniref:NAD(P)H-dependent oxidoreductase n=1 Tax=Vibrio sonorensis TaxID=1004316 RepID=UPI0008DAD75A|nr:NAD(P)H-dependent oxidoreductase [Vibrio sonorensis]
MKVLIVHWHPEPQSFNTAMFNTAVDTLTALGHQVQVSNLRQMQFNPVSGRHNFTTTSNPEFYKQQLEEMHASEHDGFASDVENELRKLEWCDLLILQYPMWWFGMPAMVKGWVDRVFVMGRFYGNGRYYENGVFKGKKAMVSITTGGDGDAYSPGGWNGDLLGVLRPIHRGLFQFNGFDVLAPNATFAPTHLSQSEREEELHKLSVRLMNIETELPINVGSY